MPEAIWVLPAQNVTPRRKPDSRNLVDCYLYRTGGQRAAFPRGAASSTSATPIRATRTPAACRRCAPASSRSAWPATSPPSRRPSSSNHAIPDAIVSPDEVIGEEERDRLERSGTASFRRGGSGRVVVAETGLKVQLLSHSHGRPGGPGRHEGDQGGHLPTPFTCPLSFLTSETNLANLQAAEHQHMAKAITPRLQRRDEKLNEQLVPLYDPTGRLFLASEDPVPVNREHDLKQQQLDLKYGVVTINEVRSEPGLPPVPWGDVPWLPRSPAADRRSSRTNQTTARRQR